LVVNRTYKLRSRRAGLISSGEILEELVERAADRKRRQRKLQGLQLELFAPEPVPRDPGRPLVDLLPEAYDV
jgi:hypothetical protein